MLNIHRYNPSNILALVPIRSNASLLNKSPLKKHAISRPFTSGKPIRSAPVLAKSSSYKYAAGATIVSLLGGSMYLYVTKDYEEIPKAFNKMKAILSLTGEKEKLKRIPELEQREIPSEKKAEQVPEPPQVKIKLELEKSEKPVSEQKDVLESRPNEEQSAEEKTKQDNVATPVEPSEGETNTHSEAEPSSGINEERVAKKEEELPVISPSPSPSEVNPKPSASDTPAATHTDKKEEKHISPDTQNLAPDIRAGSTQAADPSEHMKRMEQFGEARSEEALSSEFPFVHGNTEPADSGAEQQLARMRRGYQQFVDSKARLSENLKSQILETERVMENPQNWVAYQSLDTLENLQLEFEAEYSGCREHTLTCLSQLGGPDAALVDKYESLMTSAHDEVTSSLLSLSRAKSALQEVKQRRISDKESLQLYTDKISHLQTELGSARHELSRLRRESAASQEAMERKHSDSMTSTEGEAKKMMYQLIEAHHDHMATRLAEHTGELNREWSRILTEELELARSNFRGEKSSVLVRLKGISRGLEECEGSLTSMRDFQVVRSLVDELQEFINSREDSVPSKLFIRQRVLRLSQHLKHRSDMRQLLERIPRGVLVHGLSSKRWLVERFAGVERSCWRLAHVQDGQGLTGYVASYFRSLLTPHSPPKTADIPDGLESLPQSNAPKLRHARKFVQRGDLYNAALLMNSLRGVARTEASAWVRDAVSYLETEQVIQVLYWYLNASVVGAAK